jgi:integrase/recombinase XerC
MGRLGSAFASAPRSRTAAGRRTCSYRTGGSVKLKRFWRWKRERGEDQTPGAPMFCNQSARRISKRRVQFAWRTWQKKAGFDRLYPFHATRHSAVTNLYRATHDLFLAQRFARHASPLTTVVYAHPSDEEMSRRIRRLAS